MGEVSKDCEIARRIARVAARLFAERGYECTPVRLIAEEAGVAKPTLYHYFGSKEGLARELLSVPLARLVGRLQELLDAPGDPIPRLVAMTEAYLNFSREDPERARFVHALFFGPKGSEVASEPLRYSVCLRERLAEAVGRAAEAGLVAPEEVDACTTALRGLIVIRAMDFLYQGKPMGADLAPRLVKGLIEGFGRPAVKHDPGREAGGPGAASLGESVDA